MHRNLDERRPIYKKAVQIGHLSVFNSKWPGARNSSRTVKGAGAAKKRSSPKIIGSSKSRGVVDHHPTYAVMIEEAIDALKEKTGSSRQAILKYIVAHHMLGSDIKKVNAHLRTALKRGVSSGILSQPKGTGASGSFKLAKERKMTPA